MAVYWPSNLGYVDPDDIAGYPCQTCRLMYYSRRKLANHSCYPYGCPVSKRPSPKRVLTAEQVQAIRAECAEGHMQKDVGERYGVTPGVISNIVQRRTYVDI